MKELIFSGELRPGVERVKVVAALARRFRRSPAEIEQRLFSGKPVRIASVETRGEAVRRAAELARLGMMVEIRDAGAATPARGGRWPRRWLIGGALGLLVLAVTGATGAWYTAPVWRGGDRSAAEIASARGLATQDLLLLGHLDARRASALERRFLGERDPGALLGGDEDLWTSLQAHGIDPRAQLDDVLVAGYMGGDGLDIAAVLLGSFEPERLRKWIESRYTIEADFESTTTVHFRLPGEDECAPGKLLAAQLGTDRVLIAPAARLAELGRRIEASGPPALDLARWNRLTAEQVTTLAVFATERLGEAAGGFAGMMLAATAQSHEPVESFYAGFAPVMLPPGVRLQAEVVSPDTEYLEQTVASVREYLDESAARAARGWPELVPLYDRASLERAGNTLRAGLRLDTDFDDELGALATAIVSDLFSFGPDGSATRPEMVDNDPPQFGDVAADAIRPYDHWGEGGAAGWQGGPFAVRVAATGLDERRHTVKLEVEGRGLPNSAGLHTGVRFRVDDVVDADGNSLLTAPDCGGGENREWVAIDRTTEGQAFRDGEVVRFPRTVGTHEVTLAEGRTAADIARITGRLEYELATRIDRRTLEAPLGGETVEQDGLRIRFRPGGTQELAYDYSGETDRLLAVRALNDQGQVLRQGSAFRGGRLFGRGQSATVAYRGDVRAAEVVIARERETRRYGVRLDGGLPALVESELEAPPLPSRATPETMARRFEAEPPPVEFDYNQPLATIESGPLLIALERMQVSGGFGLFGNVAVYAPGNLSLAHDLNGATLHVDRIVRAGGDTLAPGLTDSFALEPDGAHWMNGEYTVREDRDWLSGLSGFQLSDYEGAEPAAIEGRVRLRTATDTSWTEFSARVGNRMRTDVFDIDVIGWSGGSHGRVTMRVRGPTERIVAATALDAERRRVDTDTELRHNEDDATLTIRVRRWPKFIRLYHATASEEREYAFRLQPAG